MDSFYASVFNDKAIRSNSCRDLCAKRSGSPGRKKGVSRVVYLSVPKLNSADVTVLA